ncbi:unnamed protein product [Prorocentrum cordatum]|uniref:Uncharacterized protein n=1 Tax=Prorocentrum cordatum TaxID=2364126 RepID=A0ABN9V4H3_9DINO|nr:unnamed protein product [Polarella glacialis]
MGCCMASYRSQAAEPQMPPSVPELEEVPVPADVQAAEPQLPPDMPELEEVLVPGHRQADWERGGGLELDPVLGSGAVVLMDAEWMVRRARTGGVLEPRQALPPTAFMSHSAVKAATPQYFGGLLLHIACISHCWLQANHPDPRGHNLRILGRALQLASCATGPFVEYSGRWGVFMDFCCIHQNCRDREGCPQQRTYQRLEGSDSFEDDALGRFELEHALFKEALGSLGSFYSHPATVVFMLTRFPDDYGDAAKYTRSGNTEQYFNRGWCFCESSWAMLTKPSDRLVDLGRSTGAEALYSELVDTCTAGRRAPLLPDAFDVQLQSKGFTNGKDDRPRVAELYRSAFAQRFEAAKVLRYGALEWGDEAAQQLAAVLASGAAPQLRELDLGKTAWATRAPRGWRRPCAPRARCPSCGGSTSAPTAWATRAPRGWRRPCAPRARCPSCGSSASLATAWATRAPNRVGDEGAARLAEALRAPGALPQLRELNLGANPLGGPGRAALRAAWAEAERPEGGLFDFD